MVDNKTTITVVNTPEYITYYCPHCSEEIKIPYSDFLNMMPGEYYLNWIQETFECPECGKEVEVEYVGWN